MGTWINTGLYAQMWQAIAVNGDHADYDWTVKVDANCEFFLHQLVDCIKLLPAAPTGAFVAKLVEYGFFDNLEVFSKTAFTIVLANVDACKTKAVKNWKVGTYKGKYGPDKVDANAVTLA